jgi:hypothetical protein
MSDKEYIATARATHDQDGHGREFEECQYGVCKAANLLTERAALEADNARLREAVAAMVTATSNFNVGLAEARELADAALTPSGAGGEMSDTYFEAKQTLERWAMENMIMPNDVHYVAARLETLEKLSEACDQLTAERDALQQRADAAEGLARAAQVIVDWDEPYIHVERKEMNELRAALAAYKQAGGK